LWHHAGMDTPQRADTRPARDPAKLPKGWTEHSLGELPRPALTGAMLDDRFEVKGRLGEGGMADLYLGADRLLRCRVAIKILRDDSPDSRARFLREAEVLSNVHHENLVDVVARGAVQPGGMPYTVLRFLPGEDLKTRLVEGGPLAWATVVEIGIQVADALACLHEAGVLHRDVKPENIMWTHHTSRRVFVKLIDLGTARTSLRFQGRQDRSFTPVYELRGTAAGSAVGTRQYMPPEAGLQEPDARTDIFALGVTLYQLCTGKLPDDPLTPTPVRAANPDAQIPEDLERVIMAALQWDADERTPTAAKLHRELTALRAVHATAVDEGGLFAGRIELREHLATGAEAEVFRAYHCKLRRPVALKRLLERLEGNPDDRARFEREAWVLAALDHPGLPDVLDSGTRTGAPTR
jgi:serine/threonine protein kinase